MPRIRRVYNGGTLLRVLCPVGMCMLFVAVNVKLTQTIERKTSTIIYGLFRSYDSNDNGWIALFFMLFLVLTTVLGVVCYKKRWYKAITVYIVANSIALVVVYAFFQFRNVLYACSIPISFPTASLIVFNFGCFGVICLHWKTSKRLHQFYLIMLAALTAIFLVNNMPDWTVWIALMALCAWDVIAVLTPCGPLKMLVETASRRGDDNFPAILYNASSFPGSPDTARSNSTQMTEFQSSANSFAVYSDSLTTTPLTPRRTREVREVEGNIRLGMGDFVFYSLMMGNAVQTASMPTALACFISNLVGLIITLPVVTLSQSALPALPFPLAMAAIFYFSSHFALTPFTDLCTTRLLLF